MLIKIKYIGLLDAWDDHLYGSGTWIQGEPREVEDFLAMQLLKHPEFEDARHHKQRGPIEAVIPEKPVEEPEEWEQAPLQSFEAMTKEQIATFAKRTFGADLPTKQTKAEMIDRVRFLMGKPTQSVG